MSFIHFLVNKSPVLLGWGRFLVKTLKHPKFQAFQNPLSIGFAEQMNYVALLCTLPSCFSISSRFGVTKFSNNLTKKVSCSFTEFTFRLNCSLMCTVKGKSNQKCLTVLKYAVFQPYKCIIFMWKSKMGFASKW